MLAVTALERMEKWQLSHQKSKNGKIVAYKFKSCVGRTDDGKQILRYATWHVPDGLIPSRARKAAERAAAQWEKEARTEWTIYHIAELTKADRRRCLGDTEQPAEKAQR